MIRHFHGRVMVRHYPPTAFGPARTGYAIRVYNTSTGRLINSDDGYHELRRAMDDCARRVYVAQQAWSMDLRKRDLRQVSS